MYNNNKTYHKRDTTIIYPSFHTTNNKTHSTQNHTNTLHLTLTKQLKPNTFSSNKITKSISLYINYKTYKQKYPTNINITHIKLELQTHQTTTHKLNLNQHLITYLPKYTPTITNIKSLFNTFQKLPNTTIYIETLTNFTHHHNLPQLHQSKHLNNITHTKPTNNKPIIILLNTFNH